MQVRKEMWQSQVEIEYYSVAYFERITKFDALLGPNISSLMSGCGRGQDLFL